MKNERTLYLNYYEKWIEGYEGLYSVTTDGDVFNWNYNRTGIKHSVATEPTHKGYLRVALRKNGKRKRHRLHRLVALAFIPNTEGKHEVNHINGIKEKNTVNNLEWATCQENIDHAMQTGLHVYSRVKFDSIF